MTRSALRKNATKDLGLGPILEFVLGIGRIDDGLAVAFEAIAVGVASVSLELWGDLVSGNVGGPSSFQPYEFDIGRQPGEVDRKTGRGLLQPECLLDHIVTAEYANARAGDVGRGEKGKAHDVVPVHVGHDHVDYNRSGFPCRHDAAAEPSRAAAHVADKELRIPGFDLHARRMPAVSLRDRELEIVFDERPQLVGRIHALGDCQGKCRLDLAADVGRCQCDGDGTACSPESDQHPVPLGLVGLDSCG